MPIMVVRTYLALMLVFVSELIADLARYVAPPRREIAARVLGRDLTPGSTPDLTPETPAE